MSSWRRILCVLVCGQRPRICPRVSPPFLHLLQAASSRGSTLFIAARVGIRFVLSLIASVTLGGLRRSPHISHWLLIGSSPKSWPPCPCHHTYSDHLAWYWLRFWALNSFSLASVRGQGTPRVFAYSRSLLDCGRSKVALTIGSFDSRAVRPFRRAAIGTILSNYNNPSPLTGLAE